MEHAQIVKGFKRMTVHHKRARSRIPQLEAPGIYILYLPYAGKYYVGSASYISQNVRLLLNSLKGAGHSNPELRAAFKHNNEEFEVYTRRIYDAIDIKAAHDQLYATLKPLGLLFNKRPSPGIRQPLKEAA